MESSDAAALQRVAAGCADLVQAQFGRTLDGSIESLDELDSVCQDLLADGPLHGPRLDLWWKLIGAYTGEVVIRAYDGQWITHDDTPGAYAVTALGITATPRPGAWPPGRPGTPAALALTPPSES